MPALRFRLLTPVLLATGPAWLTPAIAAAQTGTAAADTAQPPAPPPPPPPPPEGLWAADSNHDGKLTREEVTAFLEARFAALDSDGEGKVAVAALTRMQHRDGDGHRGWRGLPPPDGPPPAGGPPPGRHERGPDGPPPGGRRGPPPEWRGDGPPPDGIPRAEDRNEDGQIDRAEFLAPVDELFANRDRNGDGVLTRDELPPPPPPPRRPHDDAAPTGE